MTSTSLFPPLYAQQLQAGMQGERSAIRELLLSTQDYDGEGALQHGINLLAIREKRPFAFRRELSKLEPVRQKRVIGTLQAARKTLRLMQVAD